MYKTTFVGNIWPSLSMFVLWNRRTITRSYIIVVKYHKETRMYLKMDPFTLGEVVQNTEMHYIIRIKMELF